MFVLADRRSICENQVAIDGLNGRAGIQSCGDTVGKRYVRELGL